MKVIIETFVTIVFLSLTVVIAAQVISSQILINGASSFHTNAVQVIEESNFDSNVITVCVEEAQEKGYELTVSVDKSAMMVCSSCNSMWEIGEEVNCPNCQSSNVYVSQISSDGLVTLVYDVSISMLGIEKEGILQSNAR